MKANPCVLTNFRKYDVGLIPVGDRKVIHVHSELCECNSCCKRISLWTTKKFEDDGAIQAIAEVTFGSGCDGALVEVDWKNGVTIDVPGTRVEVTWKLDFALVSSPHIRGFGVVSACCGTGRARGLATRTKLVSVDASAASIIEIPPFAYAVNFTSSTTTFFAATTVIQQLASDDPTGLIATINGNDPILDETEGWPIVNGAHGILLDTAANEFVNAVFMIGV